MNNIRIRVDGVVQHGPLPKVTPQLLAEVFETERRIVHIGFQPWGYWSTDIITLRIHRDYQTGLLEASLSHSSGGRSTEEEESDIEAAENLAHALLMATRFGREIEQLSRILVAVRSSPPSMVGYGEESQKLIADGWQGAMDHVYNSLIHCA